jgi:hypothetical protein
MVGPGSFNPHQPQMHILYGTITIATAMNMLMSVAVIAFIVTEWRR